LLDRHCCLAWCRSRHHVELSDSSQWNLIPKMDVEIIHTHSEYTFFLEVENQNIASLPVTEIAAIVLSTW